MKNQKRIGIFVVIGLLFIAPGAAMAETLTECSGGYISGGEYEGIELALSGEDCTIVGVIVTGAGGVRVNNPGYFILMNSIVKGVVRVQSTSGGVDGAASILHNVVDGYNIAAIDLNEADVRWNTVLDGNIRVVDRDETPSTYAEVIQNRVRQGNIVVRGAVSADVKGNRTIAGNIVCRDNIVTDAYENEALGGAVRCSREPFPEPPEPE
jgi:hypothetical protein